MARKVGMIVLIFVGFVGVAVVRSIYDFREQNDQIGAFIAVAADYANADVTGEPSEDVTPALRGKVITIDTDKDTVDSLTFPKLSEGLRAMKPEEVGTVVRIQWSKERVGVYKDTKTAEETGDAFRSFGKVSIIDWEQKKVIGSKTFVGDAPVKGLTRDGGFQGEWPMFEIVQYLEGLPRS